MKVYNPLMYAMHEWQNQGIRAYFGMISLALSYQSALLQTASAYGLSPSPLTAEAHKLIAASREMTSRFSKSYDKPDFGLHDTQIAGKAVAVTEETALAKPFAKLLHFKRDIKRADPKVLIVAPMSGHHATLLRDTVKQLLPAHEVYITDWIDAKLVPLSEGEFGLDDYISYVKDFVAHIGADVHLIAVCQPTVPTLAAVARLAAEKSKAQPASLTLMGGPVDVRAAETDVTQFAHKHSIDWFSRHMVGRVPRQYPGAGRFVYPGFLQLASFVSMNPEKHAQSHNDLFKHAYDGHHDKADKIRTFYDEYFAVCDLPGKFYLDTVERVFIRQDLPDGNMTHRDKKVDLAEIRETAILSVEGENDDISAPGQTSAVHQHLRNLKPGMKFHLLQEDVGHYGIFSGSKWRESIAPNVMGFIRQVGQMRGLKYDALPAGVDIVTPQNWKTAAGKGKKPAVQ
jgi:poly(3-hydroxybutyrate) depolymerase